MAQHQLAFESLITLRCYVVPAVGEQSDDDIVIEVHETKWWQKNIEVCLQHALSKHVIAASAMPALSLCCTL